MLTRLMVKMIGMYWIRDSPLHLDAATDSASLQTSTRWAATRILSLPVDVIGMKYVGLS
jgi:hypothetical protein